MTVASDIIIPPANKYIPRPKQLLFHNSTARECLFGGAKSPGKTTAEAMDGFLYAMQYPGSKVYLFRETYPELEGSLITEFRTFVPPETYRYNDTKHTAFMCNGSVVNFRYCSSLAEAKAYDGQNMDYLGIDEVTKMVYAATQWLSTCVRSARDGVPAIIRMTSNPGGIGHGEIKKRYIDATAKGTKMGRCPITGVSIEYIPANVYDGQVHITDPTYAKRLEAMPEKQRQALLHGNWDIYEGQYFSEFGPHLREDPEVFSEPNRLKMYAGFDLGWGVEGVSAFVLGYRKIGCPKLHIAATLWLKGMTKSEQDYEIYEYLTSFHNFSGTFPKKIFCDTNIFSVDGNGNQHVDAFKRLSKYMVPANKNRLNGWAAVVDAFGKDPVTTQNKLAYWHGHNNALEETIPVLVHDDKNNLDIEKCDKDHAADALRFLVVGMNIEAGIDIKSSTNITPRVVHNLSIQCSAGNDTGMF
jgi:hypothetical protein